MKQFGLAARDVFLGALVTIPLAACGVGSDGSSSGAATAGTEVVASNGGAIDRSASTADTSSAASVAANTTPTTVTATPDSTTNTSSTSAPSGTITKVTPPVAALNGVATLDWLPPTENSDGSALTNLAGYTVYYGTSPDNLAQSVKVTNPGLTAYTVTGLTSGTWYFAVTSYSASGVESNRTNTVSTKI